MEEINRAKQIASDCLAKCKVKEGYISGTHHFVDIWARDFFMASWGTDDFETYKKGIISIIEHINKDGLVPYRLRRSSLNVIKYLGKPTYLRKIIPDYRSFQSGGIVLDGGLFLIIGIYDYYTKTSDVSFLKDNFGVVQKIHNYYEEISINGLLMQDRLCEWYDAVNRAGVGLYNNVLYCAALERYLKILTVLNSSKEEKSDTVEKINVVKSYIERKLWNGEYYSEFSIDKLNKYFNPSYNLLGIYLNVFNSERSSLIIKRILEQYNKEFALECSYPYYDKRLIPWYNKLFGISDYCRGLYWLQSICLLGCCLIDYGEKEMAITIAEKVSKQIVQYENVFEIYERNGKPVNRIFYKSEKNFAWSSGLFLNFIKKLEVCY